MSKEELITLLRSVGVNENTVAAMTNAFELGVEWQKQQQSEANIVRGSE
jgi:hypothetical protein